MFAPSFLMAWAIWLSCSYDSIEQGPAIITGLSLLFLPPNTVFLFIRTVLSSGLYSRLTSLYFLVTCMISFTPGKFRIRLWSMYSLLPITPIAVLWDPGRRSAFRSNFSMVLMTSSIWVFVALLFITINMIWFG